MNKLTLSFLIFPILVNASYVELVCKKKELSDLSKKFKELKSLVYEYKDNKEDEIQILNNNLDELKKTIDENQKKYEQVLDAATSEISSFIKNMDNKNISN